MPLQPAESAYLSLTVPCEHFRLFQGQACVVPESKDPHTHTQEDYNGATLPNAKARFFFIKYGLAQDL